MLGAIAGDTIGSRFEMCNMARRSFKLFTRWNRFTDDTVLTVAVADAILSGVPYEEKLREYCRLYPDAGYGLKFLGWVQGAEDGCCDSYGNGGAMRVSPVAWAFDDMTAVLEEAERSARPSHSHREGIMGAQAIALATFFARTGKTKEEIKAAVEMHFGYDLDRTIEEIAPLYSFNTAAARSVPEAIIAFLESENYEDAVRRTIWLGGDSDTLACMAGSISEAYYKGLPEGFEEKALSYLDERLLEVVVRFREKFVLPKM